MTSKPAPNEKDVAALLTFLSDSSEQTVALAKNHLKQILRQNPGVPQFAGKPGKPARWQATPKFSWKKRGWKN